jgi:hypothetical protein
LYTSATDRGEVLAAGSALVTGTWRTTVFESERVELTTAPAPTPTARVARRVITTIAMRAGRLIFSFLSVSICPT